jgi:hypothetical protein
MSSEMHQCLGLTRTTEVAGSNDAVISAPAMCQGLRVPYLVVPTVAQGTRSLARPG